jgi:hypothetical protein
MADEDQITLTLEGDRARDGVSLAAFDSFVSHFLLALRYHYRSARTSVLRRSGRPLVDEELATSFRLVAFRKGSGIAVLEPGLPPDADALTGELPPTLAWENLAGLLDAIDREDRLDVSITSELDAALKALGRQPRISVDVVRAGSRRQHELTEERIARIRSKSEEARDVDTELTVTGVLHAIDLEPDKVAIRTPSGVDWTCEYQPALEREVLSLIGHRVLAAGRGHATSPKAGTLQLEKIRALPEPEQTQLFTGRVVPLEALKEEQGITRPQGISAFVDPSWEDTEESEDFLRALLDEQP